MRHTQPFCKVDFTKCKYLTHFYIIIWSIQKKAVLLHREIKKLIKSVLHTHDEILFTNNIYL